MLQTSASSTLFSPF